MTSPYCPSKETEVPEVVGLSLWLLSSQGLVSLVIQRLYQ